MKRMTNEEAIKELIDASHREAKYGDKDNHYREIMRRIDAFDMGIKALEKQGNGFNEVLDFFNDIMHTIYVASLGESKDNVRFARSIVYKVFARRYKIKEIERNEQQL